VTDWSAFQSSSVQCRQRQGAKQITCIVAGCHQRSKIRSRRFLKILVKMMKILVKINENQENLAETCQK
jgi:hypothetical protein